MNISHGSEEQNERKKNQSESYTHKHILRTNKGSRQKKYCRVKMAMMSVQLCGRRIH